jgi:hypothetical protein
VEPDAEDVQKQKRRPEAEDGRPRRRGRQRRMAVIPVGVEQGTQGVCPDDDLWTGGEAADQRSFPRRGMLRGLDLTRQAISPEVDGLKD